MKQHYLALSLLTLLLSCHTAPQHDPGKAIPFQATEVNAAEIPPATNTVAIEGVSLIDGLADAPKENHTVIIKNGIIETIGETGTVSIPKTAEIIQGNGLSVLPGFIDVHFHYDYIPELPTKFVRNGITSLRDPGQWIEAYDIERARGLPMPRLFLTGPHLDSPPASHPKDAYLVRDKAEVREAMSYLINQGVSAIKVYHRLPLGLIEETCKIAHSHGLPVTAHLEITDARQAILAGIDGVEHISSLGTALVSRRRAEVFRQAMMADNNARRRGRLDMWEEIDVKSQAADSLLRFLVEQQTFITPTLGPFEYRLESGKEDTLAFLAFQNMMAFTRRCYEEQVRLVVGSHGWIRYAKEGWAFQHEMELLANAGMDHMAIIQAATIQSARFLKIDDRLGSIEEGKQADLILLKGDPIQDIQAIYQINKVMLNGQWVE